MSKVREINLTLIKPKGSLVAIGSCIYNDLYLGSLGIHKTLDGDFKVTYPTKKLGNASFDVFHPINKVTAGLIKEALVKKFLAITNNGENNDD